MVGSRLSVAVAGLLIGALGAGAGFVLANRGDDCTVTATPAEWSVARHWNEATLDAIRRDLPAPTVHARNLYAVSAAMWDAWAVYDDDVEGVFVDEKHDASDGTSARGEAISYAAYRVLEARYAGAVGASDSLPQFDALMAGLCHPIEVTTIDGDSPAAVGNRVASVILAAGLEDGSNEAGGYDDLTYSPVNEPLAVVESGTVMDDPNRWQPLEIRNMMSQNGILLAVGSQEFIGPHWGYVTSFALPDPGPEGVPLDPGPPPHLGDPASDAHFKDAAVEVIRYSSLLDPAPSETIDVSPGAVGDNPLGTNDGDGLETNPVTGIPYEPNLVNRADFYRVLAEFWADGPNSETPPGHWNTLANDVSDRLAPDLRIEGRPPVVDRLEWDVKLYLALNAANHDAAIAAWGAKGHYDYVRPISMIRYMGGLGQSSNPDGPSYNASGLPVVPGLVEVITAETAAPGERHAELAGHEGEIAVYSWTGTPEDPESERGGVDWILAVDWVPYQLPTFVTPSFAAYVSGHSTFSRASAEVLAAFTGSPYYPGGLGEWTIPAGSLEFEAGPASDVVLQWASYADAADQAGISRLYGGIHVRADDFAGRRLGYEVGRMAWEKARRYYGDG